MAKQSKKNVHKLVARLGPYWKMEASAVILIPATMALITKANLGWATIISSLPMMLMLGIGALYWRGKLLRLVRSDYDFASLIHAIARIRTPVQILTLIAIISTAFAWIIPGFAVGQPDKICATIAAVLAVLEYINYYHRQLQHFDNVADFQRLLTGKGFRQSQMARDIRAISFNRK
ncbi:MAG: hypothetical protein ABJO01_12330 [Parasphingorhabdus sp.]|uniref:hypothetical protein n=1 Tax=Parasphingorhabdus sp. TaxID=2709688 RepID=UPI0032968339